MPPLSGLKAGNAVSWHHCLRTRAPRGNVKNSCRSRLIMTSARKQYKDYYEDIIEEEEPKRHIFLKESQRPDFVDKESWGKYKVPHRFQGLNLRRLDLDSFPRFRTDFDGQKGKLAWMGVECAKCGLQIRREKRTNKETSLNVYSHDSIPEEFLRSCPEKKLYPLLWRSRDPFFVLDILGIDD